ncbi:hypothetical protein Bca4012_031022 [Brassica carinata]
MAQVISFLGRKKENFLIIFFFFFVVYFNLISSSSIFFSLCFFFFLFIPIQGNPDLSFPKSSILHSVNQSSSSPPNPKPRSLLERRLCLIIISARPRNPLNFTPSCVASDSIKERRMQQRQPYIAEHVIFLLKILMTKSETLVIVGTSVQTNEEVAIKLLLLKESDAKHQNVGQE